MAKYRLTGTVVGSTYIGEVEAKSEEEAKEMGLDMADVWLCYQCNKMCEDASVETIYAELVEDEDEDEDKE